MAMRKEEDSRCEQHTTLAAMTAHQRQISVKQMSEHAGRSCSSTARGNAASRLVATTRDETNCRGCGGQEARKTNATDRGCVFKPNPMPSDTQISRGVKCRNRLGLAGKDRPRIICAVIVCLLSLITQVTTLATVNLLPINFGPIGL